ncbi:VOC family protein [Roseiarcaceae bacterium H3SJ34-1]|uniref:VOC family protein n=1 Tax=Terripilifer ovatus TaxID=3032367 RepID=UPI003AB9B3E3|nr:VOC family protein [Roseiarcaceae bacterium H3SJ34-1]
MISLEKMDHVAIEVPNIAHYIDKFVGTGGLKLLRRGVATATGVEIAMLGDRTGMKIELIENKAATELKFLHIAFRSDDVDTAAQETAAAGWALGRGPNDIAAAKARSAFMTDGQGFEFQILSYAPDSPDVAQW